MKDKDYWFITKPKIKPLKKEYVPIKGRPRVCFTYEEAQTLVQQECIQSGPEYAHWWKLNQPYKMPKRPDRAYKNVWQGWGHFLGVYNEYPIKKKQYKTYEDAQRYMHKQRLKSYEDWKQFCRDGKRPEDIPSNPQVVYHRIRKWNGWKEFLGYTVKDRIESINASVPIFYIMRNDSLPNGVYRIGVLLGSPADIIDASNKLNHKTVATYLLPRDFDWKLFLKESFEEYAYGEKNDYILQSLSNLLFYLDTEFDKINCSAS